MKIPVHIVFRNIEPSEMVEELIRNEAAKLETFSDRIMGCRVAVEIPHRHRRKGSPYHVRIDLTLPGKEIVVKRAPSLAQRTKQEGELNLTKDLEVDIPHKNLRIAINDAFKAAGRRLQDCTRRQRGQVKSHESRPVAQVSKLLPDEGYGFLTTPEGREIYFHQDSVLNRGFHRLRIGTKVSFVEEQGEKGPQASTVRLAGPNGKPRITKPPAAAAG